MFFRLFDKRPVFEMGEYAGELPHKFISFLGLENESNELKYSRTEGTEKLPDLTQRSESDVECRGSHESSERRLVDLQVKPVGEVHMESAEKVNVHIFINFVESVQGDSRDNSHIIMTHSLG